MGLEGVREVLGRVCWRFSRLPPSSPAVRAIYARSCPAPRARSNSCFAEWVCLAVSLARALSLSSEVRRMRRKPSNPQPTSFTFVLHVELEGQG